MLEVNSRSFALRDDVDFVENAEKSVYTLPYNQELVHSAVGYLEDGMIQLADLAKVTDHDDIASAFVHAQRNFGRVFKTAYNYDALEVNEYEMPTVGDVHRDLSWSRDSGNIPPRTITIEKTNTEVYLRYEHGFNATGDTVTIPEEMTDSLTRSGILNCGRGLSEIHAPFNPSRGEAWRYRPSTIRVSIKAEDGNVTIGVSHNPPKQPRWYPVYSRLSHTGSPYAYVTFDMEEQSRVAKFQYNKSHTDTPFDL